MKTYKFESREEWLAARRGKITGSRLKEIITKRGNGKKIGFYELIAERLGIPADGENPMDRGTRLEPEAIERFSQETGRKVDSSLVIWTRDDDENIALSPDGIIGKTEALEAKCLASARHIQAYLTQQIPDDYREQAIQYFVVNDKLRKLHFAFYDPRLLAKPFFIITITRKELEEEIEAALEYERTTLAEIDEIVLTLSNF